MKNKKFSRASLLLLVGGLLLATLTQVIRRYINLSDFFAGCLIGVGIAMEITALLKMKRPDKCA